MWVVLGISDLIFCVMNGPIPPACALKTALFTCIGGVSWQCLEDSRNLQFYDRIMGSLEESGMLAETWMLPMRPNAAEKEHMYTMEEFS